MLKLLEWLSAADEDRLVSFIDELTGRSPEQRLLYSDLIRAAANGALTDQVRERVYNAACNSGLGHMVKMMLPVAAVMRASKPILEPKGSLADLPLGTRKWKARFRDADLLQMLERDHSEEVVEILLNNSRLTEKDVLFMASRRPASEKSMTRIFAHPTWVCRQSIQEALARNPYSPSHLAAALTPLLPTQVLQDLETDVNVHPLVRKSAATILKTVRVSEETVLRRELPQEPVP